MAKEMNAAVLVLTQLGRGCEGRRPNLSDLRESGDIEQHADCVLMLYKEQQPDNEREVDELEVLIRKQRNGPLGNVKLIHRKQYFDLCNFAPRFEQTRKPSSWPPFHCPLKPGQLTAI